MKPLTKEDFFKVKTKGHFKQIVDRILLEIKSGIRKKTLMSAVVNEIPGLGSASNIFDIIKSFAIGLPDNERPSNILGKLDFDDNIEKIIEEDILIKFLKFLSLSINEDDSTSIENFDINLELQKWLSDNYNKRTISGFNESLLKKYIALTLS